MKAPPPSGEPLELLCEDHRGTYVIPYLCHWIEGGWHAVNSGKQIQAKVVGWRTRAERGVSQPRRSSPYIAFCATGAPRADPRIEIYGTTRSSFLKFESYQAALSSLYVQV